MIEAPTMESAEFRSVTLHLDVLTDIVIELVAALPTDRTAGFVTALGNRLTGRMCDTEIDECTDDAMVWIWRPSSLH